MGRGRLLPLFLWQKRVKNVSENREINDLKGNKRENMKVLKKPHFKGLFGAFTVFFERK